MLLMRELGTLSPSLVFVSLLVSLNSKIVLRLTSDTLELFDSPRYQSCQGTRERGRMGGFQTSRISSDRAASRLLDSTHPRST